MLIWSFGVLKAVAGLYGVVQTVVWLYTGAPVSGLRFTPSPTPGGRESRIPKLGTCILIRGLLSRFCRGFWLRFRKPANPGGSTQEPGGSQIPTIEAFIIIRIGVPLKGSFKVVYRGSIVGFYQRP